jgi:hypothetical protein
MSQRNRPNQPLPNQNMMPRFEAQHFRLRESAMQEDVDAMMRWVNDRIAAGWQIVSNEKFYNHEAGVIHAVVTVARAVERRVMPVAGTVSEEIPTRYTPRR